MEGLKTIPRTIPQRTCLACRQVKPKRELIRLVYSSENRVEVDTSGKKAGRGAYLCRDIRCWDTGLKGNRLEHSLKTTLSADNREELLRFGRILLTKE
ncbi:MAG: YlxR family protein [Chloroflexota bacterium]